MIYFLSCGHLVNISYIKYLNQDFSYFVKIINIFTDFAQTFKQHCVYIYIYIYIYTVGKISIEHVTIFLSKYISKGAVDLTFSPDVNPQPK